MVTADELRDLGRPDLRETLQIWKLGAERTQPADATPSGGSRSPQGGGGGENNDRTAERDENATPPPAPADTTGDAEFIVQEAGDP